MKLSGETYTELNGAVLSNIEYHCCCKILINFCESTVEQYGAM